MVVSERILVDVGLEILRTNGMVDARDATLYQRPKALNAVGVNSTTDILKQKQQAAFLVSILSDISFYLPPSQLFG